MFSTVGDAQYCGEWSVPWEGIMSKLGDILSAGDMFSMGEYLDNRGGWAVPWGESFVI